MNIEEILSILLGIVAILLILYSSELNVTSYKKDNKSIYVFLAGFSLGALSIIIGGL